jgi:hypothetical protein
MGNIMTKDFMSLCRLNRLPKTRVLVASRRCFIADLGRQLNRNIRFSPAELFTIVDRVMSGLSGMGPAVVLDTQALIGYFIILIIDCGPMKNWKILASC